MNTHSQEILIDDDPELRALLTSFLDGEDRGAGALVNGARKTRAARRPAPDVLVIDITPARTGGSPRCRVLHPRSDLSALILEALDGDGDTAPTSGRGAADGEPRTFHKRNRFATVPDAREADGPDPANGPVQPHGSRQVAPPMFAANDSPPGRTARFAGWALDLARHRLLAQGRAPVTLPPTEFGLLLTFLEHPRQLLAREELASESRSTGEPISGRTIDVYVSRLRRHLSADAAGAELIGTRHGQGYVFDTDVVFE